SGAEHLGGSCSLAPVKGKADERWPGGPEVNGPEVEESRADPKTLGDLGDAAEEHGIARDVECPMLLAVPLQHEAADVCRPGNPPWPVPGRRSLHANLLSLVPRNLRFPPRR